MQINPGINHFNITASSLPAWSEALSHSEKKRMKRMKSKLIRLLINNDEEAIDDFSSVFLLPVTKCMCAFFKSPLFVVSKIERTTRNNAHVPIWSLDKERISTIKLISPKNVSEKRCKKV